MKPLLCLGGKPEQNGLDLTAAMLGKEGMSLLRCQPYSIIHALVTMREDYHSLVCLKLKPKTTWELLRVVAHYTGICYTHAPGTIKAFRYSQ